MTHADLVARAARWLRNNRRCPVVLTEAAGGREIPDAIGWRSGGRVSVLVECKASRADFLRDGKKFHRRHAEHFGIGQQRFYMAPSGLLRADEIPAGWGFVEVAEHGRTRVVVGLPKIEALNREITAREVGYLYSALWKAQNILAPPVCP